jgi:hypothetical protein
MRIVIRVIICRRETKGEIMGNMVVVGIIIISRVMIVVDMEIII